MTETKGTAIPTLSHFL